MFEVEIFFDMFLENRQWISADSFSLMEKKKDCVKEWQENKMFKVRWSSMSADWTIQVEIVNHRPRKLKLFNCLSF